MSDKLKKLTGKNKTEYEKIASEVINNSDVELFKELVANDGFLFDFVKQNVSQRLAQACNENNFRNLLNFLEYYSPYYDEFIASTLAKYADEDLTDEMLELLENGSVPQKTYCAKFFSYIQDPLAIGLLQENSYGANDSLNANCAATLGIFRDKTSYNTALEKLNSKDEFEIFSAVKFLTAYGDKNALNAIITAMQSSVMAENIAGEIPYLENLFSILENNRENGLLVLNNIVNGLGEILELSCVFDYELYDVFEGIINAPQDGKSAAVLLNACEKFNTLTENDEYLFDEDKNTKNEINDIKKLLAGINKKTLTNLLTGELNENSPFIYTALDFAQDVLAIRELLKSSNQTIILKTAEILKKLNNLDESTKTVALLKVSDENIKSIIRSL